MTRRDAGILRWYARWVARQHGRFTLFWWAKRCFYSLHLSFFAILPFLALNRSWLLEKDRMLVEKRTIVYLSVAMTRYLFLRFLLLTEFRILNRAYYGDTPFWWMHHKYQFIFICCKSRCDISRIMFTIMSQDLMGASVTLWDRPFSTESLIRSSSICTCVINKWTAHNWNMNVNVYCII